MSEMPEQISAWYFIHSKQSEVMQGGWDITEDRKTVKYVRSDLVDAKDARIAGLEAEIKAYKRAEAVPRKETLIDVISEEARARNASPNVAPSGNIDDVEVQPIRRQAKKKVKFQRKTTKA